jgi:hypothetical protein
MRLSPQELSANISVTRIYEVVFRVDFSDTDISIRKVGFNMWLVYRGDRQLFFGVTLPCHRMYLIADHMARHDRRENLIKNILSQPLVATY